MMTRNELVEKVDAILSKMEEAYEEEGIEGDFTDAPRYYLSDASEDEINNDYERWVVNSK